MINLAIHGQIAGRLSSLPPEAATVPVRAAVGAEGAAVDVAGATG
jgi:hypothetical protein